MILADISIGAAVFVDANVLVYHFGPDPTFGAACRQFVERIERQEVVAFTTPHVVSDVAHRLMTLEAISAFGWPVTGIANRLKKHPAELQKLTNYKTALHGIRNSKLRIISTSLADVLAAADECQQHGLLSGDGLIVAVMRLNGLVHLASTDRDFDRVPGVTRYAPA